MCLALHDACSCVCIYCKTSALDIGSKKTICLLTDLLISTHTHLLVRDLKEFKYSRVCSHITQQALLVLAWLMARTRVGHAQPSQTLKNLFHRTIILRRLRVNRWTDVVVNGRLVTQALHQETSTPALTLNITSWTNKHFMTIYTR